MVLATLRREWLRLVASIGSVWLVGLVMIFFPVVLLMLTIAAMLIGTALAGGFVGKRVFHRIRQKTVLCKKSRSDLKEDDHAHSGVFHLAGG
ncbi:MAG: hypothetical protein KatS3mg104_1250 [Phycisphaerae bacterium]|jgi:hypothetical protein|nr:MAG: hypothetical protein KatS3mg104_1250 [Phycisphaerae bacterium]